MKCPDYLAPKWHHLAWFMSGGGCACIVLALSTATFSRCCAVACPSVEPQPVVTDATTRESIMDKIARLNRKLDCAECLPPR